MTSQNTRIKFALLFVFVFTSVISCQVIDLKSKVKRLEQRLNTSNDEIFKHLTKP